MSLMIAGLIVFFLIHLLPGVTSLRTALVNRLGEWPYKGVFALVSLAGFVMIVMGKAQADFIPLWTPPHVLGALTKLLMLPAMVLLVAAYIPSNIRRHVRHPMMTAVIVWAVGHLLSNGDQASILLFGSFLIFAIVSQFSMNHRGKGGSDKVYPVYLDVAVLLSGGAAYALMGFYHLKLFGVSIV